jgi:hypothetical protein
VLARCGYLTALAQLMRATSACERRVGVKALRIPNRTTLADCGVTLVEFTLDRLQPRSSLLDDCARTTAVEELDALGRELLDAALQLMHVWFAHNDVSSFGRVHSFSAQRETRQNGRCGTLPVQTIRGVSTRGAKVNKDDERDERALASRQHGNSFANIAKEVGLANRRDALDAYRRAVRRRSPEEQKALRKAERQRCDALAAKIRADKTLTGDESAKRLAGVARLRAALG